MASIHRLAGRGDPFELLAALEAGADPNERGHEERTPLMHAAKANDRVAIRLLLKWGANVDATDAQERTALLDAPDLSTKRLLLDAGADPDRGRIAGMTAMAFFASFRDRRMVDLFLTYGADPEAMTRKGPSVRSLLDDPETAWMVPFPMDTPERRTSNAKAILRLSDGLRLTPEAYVAEHRDILVWSFGAYPYDDSALQTWAARVSELLSSPDRLEEAYRLHLAGDTLQDALRSLARPRQRAELERLRRERAAEFEAIHLDSEPIIRTP